MCFCSFREQCAVKQCDYFLHLESTVKLEKEALRRLVEQNRPVVAPALKGPNYDLTKKHDFHPSFIDIGNRRYSPPACSIVQNWTWWFVLLGVYGESCWPGTVISSEVMSSRTKRPDPLGLKPRRGLISTNTLKIICLPMKSICGFRIDSNSVATSELTRKRTHSKRLCLVSTLCLSRLWASCIGRSLVRSSNQIEPENWFYSVSVDDEDIVLSP